MRATGSWRPVSTLVLGALLIVIPAVVIGTPMPESLRIPIVRDHDGDPPVAALFSHWAHDQYRCFDCHPEIFPQSPLGFTHDDIDAGNFCGRCHNDVIAWSPDNPDTDCETCHRE